jgi:aspartyl-tRNA(Asn)/glutamyl-tRNA(Gln) amidotransferase subunit A
MSVTGRTACEIRELLRANELSAAEVTTAFLERIDAIDTTLNAFITQTPDVALEQARRVDEARAHGEELPPCAGVPIALKDLIVTKGIRTTCASRILGNFVPPFDGTVAERVAAAGLPLLGKTNMDEFAMGSSNENSAFGPVRNPWDLERVPGGSSGGSAACVAAGEAPWALGSDTGGSIRQPASFCGVVGFKPTYGLVSRYGLVAFASSLDQIGPITQTVRDAAALLTIIAGHDPRDATSLDVTLPDFERELDRDLPRLRIGVIEELMGEGIDDGVRDAVVRTLELLERDGHAIEYVSLPTTEYALSVYYLIAPAEASSNLARFDGVRYGLRVEKEAMLETYLATRAAGFGDEVKRRIMLGTYALSAGYYEAFYGKALKVRRLIRNDFEKAFERFDVLVSPTSPSVAFKLGEKAQDPLTMYMSDVCTIPVNLAGLPAISVPCGLSENLPVGFQIIGKALDDALVLRVAQAVEDAVEFTLAPARAGGGEA